MNRRELLKTIGATAVLPVIGTTAVAAVNKPVVDMLTVNLSDEQKYIDFGPLTKEQADSLIEKMEEIYRLNNVEHYLTSSYVPTLEEMKEYANLKLKGAFDELTEKAFHDSLEINFDVAINLVKNYRISNSKDFIVDYIASRLFFISK